MCSFVDDRCILSSRRSVVGGPLALFLFFNYKLTIIFKIFIFS
jgi:hypothetical protein